MAKKTVVAWLALNIAMVVLYTCVPSVFFNDGHARIAGMPSLLFWFTLLPLVVPAMMAAAYAYDRYLIREYNRHRTAARRDGYE